MSIKGGIGDVVETGRGGGEISSFEWRIPDFPSLDGEGGDRFVSPLFDACDGGWGFEIYPKGLLRDSPPESVTLDLWRLDLGPPQTLDVTLGIRGPEGVENKRERRQEFSNDDRVCFWYQFCRRSKLRLMPGNVLIISLDMKSAVPSVARDNIEASTQTDEDCKEAEVPTKEKQEAFTQTDEDCKEAEVPTDKHQSSEKRAAIDDDTVEKNNNDEDHEESENKKNVKQLSQVKSTKKTFILF